jgi:hypothetical protein
MPRPRAPARTQRPFTDSIPEPERAQPSGMPQLPAAQLAPATRGPGSLAARDFTASDPPPFRLAAVTLRYTARPVPRHSAQTTVLDSSGPDAGLGWHPRYSAPRHAVVYGSAWPAMQVQAQQGEGLLRSRRRTRIASTPRGATSRRCARLGPASHVQTRRPCLRPPITARYDYDTVFPARAHF